MLRKLDPACTLAPHIIERLKYELRVRLPWVSIDKLHHQGKWELKIYHGNSRFIIITWIPDNFHVFTPAEEGKSEIVHIFSTSSDIQVFDQVVQLMTNDFVNKYGLRKS